MNKFIIILIAVAVAGGLQAPVFAQTSTSQTSTSSLQALIDSLKQQIATLQAKIQTAQQAQQQVREAAQDVKGTLKLISGLREGMSGDQVKLLQTILSADSSVYPEGKITGYFGSLTAKAIKRFQKKFGLEQVGQVGPKTLEKLNKWLEDNLLTEEDSDKPGEGKRFCAIVPPGHLIAPGWLRKQDGVKPIVPSCQVLPPGILQKLGLATTTPDVTAPVISGVAATGNTTTSVNIVWMTNEAATSKLWYSTSTPVQATSTTPSVSSSSLVTNHSVGVSGLAPSTTYYYKVESADAAGNKTVSAEFSFVTLAADTIPPIISAVAATSTTATSTHITWATNEPATSKVWYSTSTPVQATGTTPSVYSGSLTLNHDMALSGLVASTTYYYVVSSADAYGNSATTDQFSFLTASQ